MNRLLVTAVADTSKNVRFTVLQALVESEDLDSYMAQAEWSGLIPHHLLSNFLCLSCAAQNP